MREKLYQEKLTPYVEKLRKMWGITPKENKLKSEAKNINLAAVKRRATDDK